MLIKEKMKMGKIERPPHPPKEGFRATLQNFKVFAELAGS
jgi:hypothetical protein